MSVRIPNGLLIGLNHVLSHGLLLGKCLKYGSSRNKGAAFQKNTIHRKWAFVTIRGMLFKASVEFFWLAGKSANRAPFLRLPRLHSWCVAMGDIQPRCCYTELDWWAALVLKFNQRESLCDNPGFLAFLHFASLYKSQASSWAVLLLCFKQK